jgi:ParB/RepB/Spo0J family partition protein
MSQTVQIEDIIIEKRKLQLRERTLDALKESIKQVGLLFPPLVRKTAKGYKLVAGAHRIEAARQLGWKTIPIDIERSQTDDKWAEVAEIDENLIRRSLSQAEKSKIVGQRFKLLGKSLGESFISKTAAQTGASASEVHKNLKRGVELGERTLNKIKGTSLDTGEEMDALRKLPKSKRKRLIDAAAKGEAVSAVTGAKKNRVISAWSKANDEERRDFISHLRKIKAI